MVTMKSQFHDELRSASLKYFTCLISESYIIGFKFFLLLGGGSAVSADVVSSRFFHRVDHGDGRVLSIKKAMGKIALRVERSRIFVEHEFANGRGVQTFTAYTYTSPEYF